MSTDLEGRLRQRMEHATAQIQMPRGLARRAAQHRQRRILIRAGAAAVTAAAVTAAGIVVAVLPSAPIVLTAKLLADRASAAALTQPAVSPGQWVYRVVEWNQPHTPKGVPNRGTEAGWETADGGVTYGDNYSVGVDAGDNIPSYSELGSLPASVKSLLAQHAIDSWSDRKNVPYWQVHTTNLMAGRPVGPFRQGTTINFEPIASVDGQGFFLEDMYIITKDGAERCYPGEFPDSAEEIVSPR